MCTAIIQMFSNFLPKATLAVPKIQVVKSFMSLSLLICFWNGFIYFGKFVDTSHNVYMWLNFEKDFWKQHAAFIGVLIICCA
jgi:hypothetical protein